MEREVSAARLRGFWRRYGKGIGLLALFLAVVYALALPRRLFTSPYSIVLEDREGRLLGARIAADGQWRFPALQRTPDKFARAVVLFEDKRFWTHPGFDWRALARAMRQNIRAGEIVSGGSTLSMQVMRLARGNRSRTVFQKLLELLLATRLEWRCSKQEILALYASHAPFGGNVVGLEAASWRYFGKSPDLLSWAEAATLAVLPNSPALIHPGRNRPQLRTKRNRLLERLYQTGAIDSLSWVLAKEESLPERPYPLPRLAPHLLDRAALLDPSGRAARINSTLDGALQQQAAALIGRHCERLSYNEIHNMAALVIHIPTGEVLAYVGNAPGAGADHGEAVDIIQAPRSTGSILKPLLYALMLQEGTLAPGELIADVPTAIGGYQPENYNGRYDGAVAADRALVRSLNVPMVLLLRDYGVEKFHFELRKLGFAFINQPPDHYGLSLILGGAEASLWQITNAYAGMSRTLGHYAPLDGRYLPTDFRPAHYRQEPAAELPDRREALAEAPYFGAGAIWLTLQAMRRLERPDSEGAWEVFYSSRPIAWKTGTSFGFRDAWAIGVDAEYAVGVWAGNADGEGRPGLAGVQAAAPVLFGLFDLLPAARGFDIPYDDLRQKSVCAQSGARALPICPVDTVWAPAGADRLAPCSFHRIVQVDASETWRLHAQCAAMGEMRQKSWFVLPPVMEYYYKGKDPNYRPLPPFRPDCAGELADGGDGPMQMIHPRSGAELYLPVDLNGQVTAIVFRAAHRTPESLIYWHLDEHYLGSTRDFHELAVDPSPGPHVLTLVDQYGQRLVCRFTILEKK